MLKQAVFSKCNQYRYKLSRIWDKNKEVCLFIGLNPSRADAAFDDPTIKKLINFAHLWDFGGFNICNLFAFRTPHPKDLLKTKDPKGVLNEFYLFSAIESSPKQILMWGNHGFFYPELDKILAELSDPHCFGFNKNGSPQHPLYLPSDTIPIPFIKGC